MHRLIAAILLAAGGGLASGQPETALPNRDGSVRFAVIGDSGTGGGAQRKVAEQIAAAHARFRFDFAIMLGDNLYGREREGDYQSKFERPYKPLLDAGVKFYASLGNHDEPDQRFYKPFNMNGERYYSFRPRLLATVRFFALDSNHVDTNQLQWLEKELSSSTSPWKIAFFHHPIYSSGGRHGSDMVLREQLEPLFLKHGVTAVFTGHEHFYERTKPQKGIHYFIAGASAKLRRGDIERSPLTAKGYDQGYTFMLIEIAGDEMHFQAVDENGRIVDSGSLKRRQPQARATNPCCSPRSWSLPEAS
jgi:predicted MPP superfamily phosphohydrolase